MLLFVFAATNVQAQQEWNVLQKLTYNKKQEKELYTKKNFPAQYELMSLNLEAFSTGLQLKSQKGNQIIELPDNHGHLQQFRVVETSNFEEGLQAQFPGIKSYTAKSLSDATAVAKISLGSDGFHAVISSANHPSIYIDPYSKDKKEYIVYSRTELPKIEQDFQCMVEDNVKEEMATMSLGRFINDGKLRTYRIAIVCSGEYAQFHLNRQGVPSTATDEVKKAAVLSAMNTSMTRINGVFEKDLGVRMVLVNDNANIIFLNAATDNITDGNASTMINEVQAICDAQIGSANYDIGHIFSVGGAGLAGLGVVCRNGQKARGVTGIASPEGDPYDIDYVAHELGHQFGATHTQNNNCNRTNSTAVEVGSGTTIMGYSGICSPNVFGVGSAKGNSDDYFHTVSIAQMQNVIQTTGNCAIATNTDNTTPTADAGQDYSIPKSTPFKLRGFASDADGISSLTYNWEQIDNEVGGTMPPESTNTAGPVFRSLPSQTVPYRHIPELKEDFGFGGASSSQWEVLPSVERELNFAFTVRDNNAGGGSTARDDMKVTITNSSAFRVTSQNTATTWDVGSTQTITWERSLTHLAPINCSLVNIRLSKDGGLTFPIILASNTPNDGSEAIVIPNQVATNAKIMVEAVGNIFYNINQGSITINSNVPTFILTNTSGDLSACNSGNESVAYTLNFDFVNNFSENVTFTFSGQPTNAQVSFSPNSINADGDVAMTVSNLDGVDPQEYTINVEATGALVVKNIDLKLDVNSTNFTALTLTTPTDNETEVSLIPQLTWQEDTNATSYDIEISDTANFSNIIISDNTTTNSYVTTTLQPTSLYYWRVKAKNSCGEGSFSSAFSFTTQACTICPSSGNTDFNTSTTLVKFNTINNPSTKTDDNLIAQGYFDYSSIATNVKVGDTHELTVHVNTDGNYGVLVKAWIDWNGDCVFNENDEEYDLGAAANVVDGITSLSPLQITVPSNAKLGTTKMRVSSRYTDPGANTYATACLNSFDGEVEDYTLVIEGPTATIEDVAFGKFNLFPNPTSGKFTLLFETVDTSKTTLELYDVRGRSVGKKVFRNTNTLFREELQFQNLSKGLYLLKINNGNKQTTRKLLIE